MISLREFGGDTPTGLLGELTDAVEARWTGPRQQAIGRNRPELISCSSESVSAGHKRAVNCVRLHNFARTFSVVAIQADRLAQHAPVLFSGLSVNLVACRWRLRRARFDRRGSRRGLASGRQPGRSSPGNPETVVAGYELICIWQIRTLGLPTAQMALRADGGHQGRRGVSSKAASAWCPWCDSSRQRRGRRNNRARWRRMSWSCFCRAFCGRGMNSSLETIWVGTGSQRGR